MRSTKEPITVSFVRTGWGRVTLARQFMECALRMLVAGNVEMTISGGTIRDRGDEHRWLKTGDSRP